MAVAARKIIQTSQAPAAIGAYSQAILVDKTLYISGQVGLVPGTGNMVEGGVEAQAEQSLKNMKGILQAAGADFPNVVKTTVLLADINDFAQVNAVYAKYFSTNPPARAAYAAAGLPKGAKVEIEAVAVLGEVKFD